MAPDMNQLSAEPHAYQAATATASPASSSLRKPPRRRKALREAPQLISLANTRLAVGQEFVAPGGCRAAGYRLAKRLFDIVVATLMLLLLSPALLGLSLALVVTTRGKPFFRQHRTGYLGRPFWMVKFRTMAVDAADRKDEVHNEQHGPIFKNRRDPRITRLGRLLRKTSLDETPQLFHVLSGRMSLVGPRPLPIEEVAQFEPWHRQRLGVMPGLTCLWQVSGRSDVGFEEWMRMDIRYVRMQSFRADLKLLAQTPLTVISGQGAY